MNSLGASPELTMPGANNTLGSNQMANGQVGGMNQNGRNLAGSNGTNEPQPWVPLIAAVLVMAASLAANVYLVPAT